MTVSISAVIALNDDPRAAARFYAEGFNSNIKSNSTTLAIGGMNLELIEDENRQLTPAVSFMVRFAPGQENQLRRLWEHLMAGDETISGGAALMPLTSYDFSPLFGWLADGNGVNWQLMVDPSPGEAESTDAAAKTANPTVIPYFMWTGDEPQAAAATEVYNQLFGSGNFMTLDSPGMHKFTFGDGVAMRISSDSAKEIESAYQALGLTDAGVAEGTDAVVKPGVQPQPDRFGVYWTL
ncbi:VOC family protein [Corynebacterium amycolatum]|uniref:VOC family protein n=1 Tax=Corynebacterium amycolatum TaxID=43765 RepID=UPI000185BF06|nr:VOC family protein [Corynebacterium amycolatum]EEB62558.1 3-demethylubiquinone-9 3-methyltransferase domain protein [Corynebacterium amycolatum SK46]